MPTTKKSKLLEVEIIAFGYKYGPAPDANLVLDVRYLKNPHYEPDLRPLTGLDSPVQEFIINTNPGARELLQQQVEMMLSGYLEYGNEHERVVLAFGCTGGKHRSRFCAFICTEIVERFLSARGLASHVRINLRDAGRE